VLVGPSIRMAANTPLELRAASTVVLSPAVAGCLGYDALASGRPPIQGRQGQITATFVDKDQRFGVELRLSLGAPGGALFLITFAGA
jgi:hypothetical protein